MAVRRGQIWRGRARDEDSARRVTDHDLGSSDDLAARLDAVTAKDDRPRSADELRAAFGPKRVEPAPEPGGFMRRYPNESLFSPVDEPVEELSFCAEDRSQTRGDYYYDPEDAWAVLGVPPGSSWDEIASAHRRLAMEHHPDRVLVSSPERQAEAEVAMREINVAYTVLRRLMGN